MKKIIFAAVIAIAFLSSCGEKAAPKGTTDSAGAPAVAAVKYQCPMKCEGDKTYDKAGKCPKCQMDMVEVK